MILFEDALGFQSADPEADHKWSAEELLLDMKGFLVRLASTRFITWANRSAEPSASHLPCEFVDARTRCGRGQIATSHVTSFALCGFARTHTASH
jgi:hypothetical protein